MSQISLFRRSTWHSKIAILLVIILGSMLNRAHETVEIRVENGIDYEENREAPINRTRTRVIIRSIGPGNHHITDRSASHVVPDFTKMGETECQEKVLEAKSRHGGQLAILVKLGHIGVLPCHHCALSTESSMNWYRLRRQVTEAGGGTVWHPEEVEVDKYDDENLNRVLVNPSHQLIVKDFQPNDMGTYFCKQYDADEEKLMKETALRSSETAATGATGAALAWSSVSGKHNIDMVVHVDIEIPQKEILVTKSGIGYPKPQPKQIDEQRNLEVQTEWGEWSVCSKCDAAGERRRRGSCHVKLVDVACHVKPRHLDHALRLYPSGAPCQSSVFSPRDVAHIASRKPEVEIERCEVPCKEQSKFFKTLSLYKKTMEQMSKAKESKTYTRFEGDSIQMFCPGAKDDTPVTWYNGSTLLDTLALPTASEGRAFLGDDNSLAIYPLTMSDAGAYSCKLRSDLSAVIEYYVRVQPHRKNIEDPRVYLKYLGMVFAGDAVLFIILMVVNHKNRLVQVRRAFKGLKGIRGRDGDRGRGGRGRGGRGRGGRGRGGMGRGGRGRGGRGRGGRGRGILVNGESTSTESDSPDTRGSEDDDSSD